jgi:hypothetical protein
MKPEIEFIGEALRILCPNGAGYNGVDITTNSDPVPTQAELDAQVLIQKSEYAKQEYARNRATAYDSIGDQLDMIYKDNLNGTTTHKDSVEAVKAKFPKPS